MRYIERVENTALWDALFVEAFATRLALEACETITQSGSKKEQLRVDFLDIIGQAWASDAIENPPDRLPEDGWIEERA